MTQFLAKMTNFRESWLPQFLEDFQNLQTEEKEETIKALVSALGEYLVYQYLNSSSTYLST